MRVIKKILSMLFLIIACCSMCSTLCLAAEKTQDGVEANLTTDKTEYKREDPIKVKVSVTNTNKSVLNNVSVETLVPEGFKARDGNSMDFQSVESGETVSFDVILNADDSTSPITMDSQGVRQEPETGDSAESVIWICLAFVSVGVIVCIIVIRKKGKRFLSLFLCATMLSSAVGVRPVITRAAEQQHTIELSSSVLMEKSKVDIEAHVHYSAELGSINDSREESYTVSFESNGGSSVKSQSVKAGEFAVKPENPSKEGCVFIGWYSNKECTEFFDFDKTDVTEDITLYALWMNLNDKTDSDADLLLDWEEEILQTDPQSSDTDGDGLSDEIEIMYTETDPTKEDTDGNGTKDGDEDFDKDGLSNLKETDIGTNPALVDSDGDNLTDYEEIYKYKTDPLLIDSDSDGASDKMELDLGYNPLKADDSFNVTFTSHEEDSVEASVDIELDGSQVETLDIEKNTNDTLFPDTIPGYIGGAYDFSVEGTFSNAIVSFAFDEKLANEDDFDPTVYYFNEEEQKLEPLETTVSDNVASASVNHFSTYILLNRTVYEESFTWMDVWDANDYTGVEIILVIDDSGSMDWNDPSNQRLSVAQDLVERLPANSKVGVVRFESGTDIITSQLSTDKEQVKSILTSDYFHSSGGTMMYNAINDSFSLFESSDSSIMKMMVVISDGDTEDTYFHSSIVSEANEQGVKLYTVGLGSSTSYFYQYLEPLSNNTGAKFYLATNADELQDIYSDISEKIDIETDSDSDGIPDYYEDNMLLFNGVTLALDKNNPDTDGDGLLDGEEIVELKYEYNEDKTQVIVTGKLKSNPSTADSDGDGLYDNEDRIANENSVAPKDPQPLVYNGPENLWKAHINQQQNHIAPAQYAKDSGLDVQVPEWLADMLVNVVLALRSPVNNDMVKSTLSVTLHIIKRFCNNEVLTVAGAYLLNFVMDEYEIAYHSQPDTWQRNFGYNDFYDEIFKIATEMNRARYEFDYKGNKYALWLWKGDYWNLHTGAEMGLYIDSTEIWGTTQYDAIDFELPMTISLYNYNFATNIKNIFSWMPESKQWWITGFNPDLMNPNPDDMAVIGSIDFTENRELFESLRDVAQRGLNSAKNTLLFDDEKSMVWICWQ